MPSGNWGYRIPNYSSGKCPFDCYANEAEAIESATRLARKLSERQHVAANMTNSEATGYAAAVESLEPYSVPLLAAAHTLAQRPSIDLLYDIEQIINPSRLTNALDQFG